MRKILFTTKTCPNCPPAKNAVADLSDIEILDANENIELAQNFRIRTVPNLVIVDNDKILEAYIGSEEIINYANEQR